MIKMEENKLNKDLKNVEDFYRKYDDTCTKKSIINSLGGIYPYVYNIEEKLIYLILIGYFLVQIIISGFKLEKFTLNIFQLICHYILLPILFLILLFLIMVICEKLLIRKIKKKYKIKDTGYQTFFWKIEIPSVNRTIKKQLETNKVEFIKKELSSYSKEQMLIIYKFTENSIRNISIEISNKSNINIYNSFITVFLTVLLTNLLSFKNIDTIKDMTIIIVYSLIIVVSMYFIYRSFIYIYKKYETNFLLGHLKNEEKQMKQFSHFIKKVIINYDYYKEEIKCMNDNVPKNAVLTQEDKDRLHERPYFTFVEANRSSLSNNLFFIDLTFKNDGMEKSFRTYPESNGKTNILNKTVTFKRVEPNRTPVIKVDQEFTTTWCFDDAKNFENCMVNVVIEFLDVLERKYTQSFEIALSMVNGEIHGDAISYSDPVLKSE